MDYQNQVKAHDPKERLISAVKGFMEFYMDLSSQEQVEIFGILKDSVLQHRSGIINDCSADAEAIKYRHEELVKGFDTIKNW